MKNTVRETFLVRWWERVYIHVTLNELANHKYRVLVLWHEPVYDYSLPWETRPWKDEARIKTIRTFDDKEEAMRFFYEAVGRWSLAGFIVNPQATLKMGFTESGVQAFINEMHGAFGRKQGNLFAKLWRDRLSESDPIAREWDTPEEDAAWADLGESEDE